MGLYLYIDIVLPEEIDNNDIVKAMRDMVNICQPELMIDHEVWSISVQDALKRNNGRPIPDWLIYPGERKKWECEFYSYIQKWDYYEVGVTIHFKVRHDIYRATVSAHVAEGPQGFYFPKPEGRKELYWGMSKVIWDSMPEEDKNKLRNYVKTISSKWNATFVFEENWEI